MTLLPGIVNERRFLSVKFRLVYERPVPPFPSTFDFPYTLFTMILIRFYNDY